VVQCDQTFISATSILLLVKKRDDRYKVNPASSLPGRNIVETVVIVLVVLFLLGGSGWGYSRWRG
jgi:hypothetical protein